MKKVVPWKQTATQNDVLLLICMFHFLDHFGSTTETNQLWSRRTWLVKNRILPLDDDNPQYMKGFEQIPEPIINP